MRLAKIFTIALIIITAGCSSLYTETSKVKDPEAKATEIVSFRVNIQPIDLDKYKNPDYNVVTRDDGTKAILMTPKQYKNTIELLTRLREYIRLQRQALEEMQEYYEQNGDRRKVDKHSRSTD